jgi:hypothetical protein
MANWKQKMKEDNERLQAEVDRLNAISKQTPPVVEQPVPTQPLVDTPPVIEEKKEKRPPTKPWEKKDGTYRPYRRDYFKLKGSHKGFRPFFANEGRIDTLIERGYRIADPKDYTGLVDKIVSDGSALGNRIVRNKMVLLEIPQEEYDAIEKAKDDHRKALMKRSRTEVKDMARRLGSEIGHEVKVSDDSKE